MAVYVIQADPKNKDLKRKYNLQWRNGKIQVNLRQRKRSHPYKHVASYPSVEDMTQMMGLSLDAEKTKALTDLMKVGA